MKRPRHYIRIVQRLEPYARKAGNLEEPWQQAIFNDITANGTALQFVRLRANERGPRLGLYGRLFYCEAGRDKQRDCLFIVHVELLGQRHLRGEVGSYKADFQLLTQPYYVSEPRAEERDELDALLPDGAGSEDGEAATQVPPSARLVSFLAHAPIALRKRWRPEKSLQALSTEDFLTAIRRVWSLFRLEKFIEEKDLKPRILALLKATITPKELDASERQLLSALFSIKLLNRFVQSRFGTQAETYRMLDDWAELPVATPVRAHLWAGMVSALEPVSLRRELHETAEALEECGQSEAKSWETVILAALRAVANRDERLRQVVDSAASDEHPVHYIAQWAKSLQFPSTTSAPVALPPRVPALSAAATPMSAPPAQQSPGPILVIKRVSPPEGVSVKAPASVAPSLAPVAAASPADTDESLGAPFEQWVLRLRLPDQSRLRELPNQIREALDQVHASLGSLERIQGVRALGHQLAALIERAKSWQQQLPAPQMLEEDLAEARHAYLQARGTLGERCDSLLVHGVGPPDLIEIDRLWGHSGLLAALPEWMWLEAPPADNGTPGPADDERLTALTNSIVRQRIQRIVERAASLKETAWKELAALPPPQANEDIERYVTATVEDALETWQGLQEAGAQHRAWVERAQREGVAPRRVLELVKRVDAIGGRISGDAATRMMAALDQQQNQMERERWMTGFYAAVETFEQEFETAREVPYSMLEKRLGKSALPTARSPGELLPPLQIEHDWVDKNARADLLFRKHRDQPYGFVSAPVVLRAEHPADFKLRLQVDVKTRHREAWNSDWPGPTPREINIAEKQWRAQGSDYVFDFKLEVPIREPEKVKDQAFEVELRAYEVQSQVPQSPARKLRWDAIQTSTERLGIQWPDEIEPAYVRDHPIGPQHRHRDIENKLLGGSSFAVEAPRRYGKSTLVEYLSRLPEESRLLIPKPVVCTSFYEENSLDYDKLWQSISDQLTVLTGASLHRSWSSGLPDANAFDHVRRAAFQQGKETIVLLFDEAQLFFPRRGGTDLGGRLKNLLERSWAGGKAQQMARVLFGFIGLPSLSERAGSDLMGLLRPYERLEFQESDLRSIVRRISKSRLEITRDARIRLAEKAGNLYILRTLLERLVDRANEDGRHWVSLRDVLAVEAELRRLLEDGMERPVAKYMRDVLNEAENISEWKPKACYPVAVAMARAKREAPPTFRERRARALELLNEWCGSLNTEYGNRRLYTAERVDEHIATLKELGVFTDDFKSELLESWLLGVSRTFPQEDARQALIAGAIERIRIPDGLEPISEGAQAQIYRFTEQDIQYALRKVPLAEPQEQRRFLDNVETLRTLQKGVHLREEGSEYVFQLRDIGLGDTSEPTGVQIYQWIDGVPLDRKEGQLGAHIVADLALKLARALRMLHRHNVLHRDIRTANVVLADDPFRPVLIDFGLAQFGSAQMGTPLSHYPAAPEVRSDRPQWTKAADIYAFGAMLQQLLQPKAKLPTRLKGIIENCTAERPTGRPDAEALVQSLEGVLDDLKIVEMQSKAWQALLTKVQADTRLPWFRLVLEKFRPRIEAILLGLHTEILDRAAETAIFLDQVLEASPVPPNSDRLKLGSVKHRPDVNGEDLRKESIDFLHQLRLDRSHIDPVVTRKLRQKFKIPDEASIMTLSQEGAMLIGKALNLSSLPDVVNLLLKAKTAA
ncbi:protein kinase [Archangium violaceum]|uniref:protein kinase domain-containing protein n=1 Tax=Archangium violaceum TaxID=83451 RepID=UPI002B310623|nr:protein kinase [Archangium gephyra]